MENPIEGLEFYAWVGEDELGSGEVGIKRAFLNGQYMALVDTNPKKVDRLDFYLGLNAQAEKYGKKIRLVRFVAAEVVAETIPGS
jgi:hypothetical protein